MSTRLAIAVSVLVAVLATVAILGAVLFISWRVTEATRASELERSASRMLQRAELIYAEATTTLSAIEDANPEPCSREHIQLMKQATTDELYIDNVAYTEGGYVRCNAYGPVDSVIPTNEIDVVQPDGVELNVNWIGPARPPRPTLVAKMGSHRALVDQRSFYDDLLSPGAVQYFTLTTLNGIAIASGRDDASMVYAVREPTDLISELKSENWTVRIDAPGLGFPTYVASLATIVILFSATLILLIGGGTLWFLLRPISGKTLIEQALRRRQFVVHYQPIIELATERCVAAEALIRLRRSDGVLLRPDLFIPYAEESGLIQPLTDNVLDSVVSEMGPLLRRDRSIHISVNVAATDIVSGRILAALDRALKDSGIAPDQIWLEMTERGFMKIEGARPTLDALRRRGHRLAIDDFGTGYSGLQYLAQLPVEMLKIDKSFIDTFGTGAATSRVTGQIIAMARELNLSLVAEGVETEEQAAFLREQHVEYAQGWLFSRAVPAADFIAFLHRTERGDPRAGSHGRLALQHPLQHP